MSSFKLKNDLSNFHHKNSSSVHGTAKKAMPHELRSALQCFSRDLIKQ